MEAAPATKTIEIDITVRFAESATEQDIASYLGCEPTGGDWEAYDNKMHDRLQAMTRDQLIDLIRSAAKVEAAGE